MKLSEIDKGTYVCANFTDSTLDLIKGVQDNLGLLDPVPREKIHTTICYSRVYIPYIPSDETIFIGDTNHLEIWETKYGSTLVLVFDDATHFHQKHELCNILGATYDFDNYVPHVTLSYNLGAQHIDVDTPINIPIVASNEKVEELDLNWK